MVLKNTPMGRAPQVKREMREEDASSGGGPATATRSGQAKRAARAADGDGTEVKLTLSRGMWWARTPSVVLMSAERAELLCKQLARRCGGEPRDRVSCASGAAMSRVTA